MDGMKPRPKAPLMLVTQEHYERLVENVVAGAQPPVQMSCDWLTRDPLRLGIQVFPVRTYEILRELRNGNSVS
jgi:hypothetical protein